MDYAMPRADNLPWLETALSEIPSPTNRLGVRSAGEIPEARSYATMRLMRRDLTLNGSLIHSVALRPCRSSEN
jgi:hypothetical protein